MISWLKRFVAELRRRRVFRVAVMYALVAWVLMQIGEIVFPALQLPDWSLTLLVVLLAFVFPVVLVLAWAFDLTPSGVVRTPSDADAGAAAGPTVEAVDAVDAAADAADMPAGPARHDGIVVLPFEDLSREKENEYFSDGITEDLIHRLYQASDLRVISRTSAWQYKDARAGAKQIAADLGVAYLVEGSVRRSGDAVRIVAQLIDAREDRHVWSDSYDRELQDIFAIQSDVAGCIADALHVTLGGDATEPSGPTGTTDLEAYDLYLKGRYLWNRRSARDLEDAVRQFQAAVERDACCTAARAGLAEAYVTLGIYGLEPAAEVMPRARDAAEEALRQSPGDPSARSALACVHAVYDWNWRQAEEDFQRIVRSHPQYSTAPQWYATNLLIPQGRFGDAVLQLDRAASVDPVSPAIESSLGVVAFMQGDYEEADRRFRALSERDDRLAFAHYYGGLSALYLGDPDAALAALDRAGRAGGDSTEVVAARGVAHAMAGREDEARDALRRMSANGGRYASPVRLAQVHTALGETDAALDRLDEAVAARATDLIWIDVFPGFAPLRGHARYAAVRDRVFGAGG